MTMLSQQWSTASWISRSWQKPITNCALSSVNWLRLGNPPNGAVAPQPIDMDCLFNLDVDDGIWQDIGLDETDMTTNPPCWMCDEKVREGIKALLKLDWCEEEEACLLHECQFLQVWFSEEWTVIGKLIEIAQNLGMQGIQCTTETLRIF